MILDWLRSRADREGVRPVPVVKAPDVAPAAPAPLPALPDAPPAVDELAKVSALVRVLLRRVDVLQAELARARRAGTSSLSNRASQDRRNAVLLCDALAISEGRARCAPLADEAAARALLDVVSRAVEELLGVPEGALSSR